MNTPAQPALAAAGQYLSFRLDAEHYGLPIMKVQEIRSYEEPTRTPNARAFVLGMVNLRGTIVPILDLRLRFGCPSAGFTPSTVVIVLDLGTRTVGVVVDAVNDVVTLEDGQVHAAPDMDAISGTCITGLAQVGERMLILLDIDALLDDEALASLPDA